ncbi:hypothetical protein JCM24511_01696 [Saitozyma sp. JCM 24511]|nr:hypothetical protein JCM24511_01696 [Saitozyma sp. JCM 24511]
MTSPTPSPRHPAKAPFTGVGDDDNPLRHRPRVTLVPRRPPSYAIPTSKRSKFHIIGPFTPQSLELSYSSSGESTNTNPSDTNDPSDPSNPSQSSSHPSHSSPQPPGPTPVKPTSSSRSAASSRSPEWRDTAEILARPENDSETAQSNLVTTAEAASPAQACGNDKPFASSPPSSPIQYHPRTPNSDSHEPLGGEASRAALISRLNQRFVHPVHPVQPVQSPPHGPLSPVYTPPSSPLLNQTAAMEATSGCSACGKTRRQGKRMQLVPCGDVVCSACFSSCIAAVCVTLGAVKCPACLKRCSTFRRFDTAPLALDHIRDDSDDEDLTPEIVESFLPRDVLPNDHPHPIHIPLDRFDGRTKDYMYVEVTSVEAAREVLQTRQNTFMPGGVLGGRKRPVTITQVTHAELLAELRPRGPRELHTLLRLCQAAISTPTLVYPRSLNTERPGLVQPNRLAHFVKSRHGPFHALMSIMSKLRHRASPAYWDVFHVSSGAIAALGTSIAQSPASTRQRIDHTGVLADERLLEQLSALFEICFGVHPACA